MALTILATPQSGDTIEAATWVNELNNIYNNSLSLISPLTGNLNINNNTLTNLALGSASAPSLYFNSDANTGIYSAGADTLNVTTGSSLALQVGASWILAAAPEDSRTDSVDVVGIIRSTTSGTPAAGIGVGVAFQAESGDENPSTFGRIDFAATDVGAGTEDTYMDILLRVAGVAEETKYRFASTAGTGLQGTFTHAVTADRTWTLPDTTGTVVLTANTLAVFASTSSTELRGIISDPTGTNSLVFNTSPSLITPSFATGLVAESTTMALLNTVATTLNFAGAATTITMGATTGITNLRHNLGLGTTVVTGVTSPSLIIKNSGNEGIVGVNAAGTGTVLLLALDASDNIKMNFATQTTIGANGGASALTANPVGYIKLNISGDTRIIPFYNP